MCKRLIMLSGIPGSGKSTYAAELKKKYGDRARIASSDAIRFEMYGAYDYFKGDGAMWKEFERRVIDWSKDDKAITILDACFLTNKVRRKWIKKLKPYYDWCELIVIETPLFECIERQELRDRKVPSDVIHNMYCKKEVPSEEMCGYFDNITERRL